MILIWILNNMFIVFNCLKYVVRSNSFIILGMILSFCYLFDLSIGFDALGYSWYWQNNKYRAGKKYTLFFNYLLFTVQAYVF